MEDFLVAGPADTPEDALTLLRATAIASFGEAVRQIARENFQYCNVHRKAVPRLQDLAQVDASVCVCPPDAASAVAAAPDPRPAPADTGVPGLGPRDGP